MKKDDISVLIPVMKRAFDDDARLSFKKQQAVRLVMTMEVSFVQGGEINVEELIKLKQDVIFCNANNAKERDVLNFCIIWKNYI